MKVPPGQTAYLVLIAVSVTSGIASWMFLAPFVVNNDKAQDVVITLFSILAGFIIAIMTLLGEQSLRVGWWGRTRIDAEANRRRLDRQQQLFWLYLATLSVLLAGRLLEIKQPAISAEVQRIGFGMATFALIISFALPVALRGAQIVRMDAAVDRERAKASPLERS